MWNSGILARLSADNGAVSSSIGGSPNALQHIRYDRAPLPDSLENNIHRLGTLDQAIRFSFIGRRTAKAFGFQPADGFAAGGLVICVLGFGNAAWLSKAQHLFETTGIERSAYSLEVHDLSFVCASIA
ncbi:MULTISPECIES: hypothetical protein [unclassified Rhizobium]|uniref:hypothetical protein n=1 Tax=unclassified Rhizobium TaxID=2613769 RepID=UPI0021F76A2D|nr:MULTISPECIES: hypothetical protein [unclassified Rhizobium]MCV9947047.1 hypothetical protein [Rhizobium sp. BT-175]MCW0020809.1 hypothetical protein [Rhizobium sp. BT-226]